MGQATSSRQWFTANHPGDWQVAGIPNPEPGLALKKTAIFHYRKRHCDVASSSIPEFVGLM
jgi:hypothetical protein